MSKAGSATMEARRSHPRIDVNFDASDDEPENDGDVVTPVVQSMESESLQPLELPSFKRGAFSGTFRPRTDESYRAHSMHQSHVITRQLSEPSPSSTDREEHLRHRASSVDSRIIPGLGRAAYDDDDDRDAAYYFMSEPSLSEDGGESSENYLLGLTRSFAASEGEGSGSSPGTPRHPRSPPPPPVRRSPRNSALSPGSLSSPGNTSLSSRDMSPVRPAGKGSSRYRIHFFAQNDIFEGKGAVDSEENADLQPRLVTSRTTRPASSSQNGCHADSGGPPPVPSLHPPQLNHTPTNAAAGSAKFQSESEQFDTPESATTATSRADTFFTPSHSQDQHHLASSEQNIKGRQQSNSYSPEMSHYLTPTEENSGENDSPNGCSERRTGLRENQAQSGSIDSEIAKASASVGVVPRLSQASSESKASSPSNASTAREADEFLHQLKTRSVGLLRAANPEDYDYEQMLAVMKTADNDEFDDRRKLQPKEASGRATIKDEMSKQQDRNNGNDSGGIRPLIGEVREGSNSPRKLVQKSSSAGHETNADDTLVMSLSVSDNEDDIGEPIDVSVFNVSLSTKTQSEDGTGDQSAADDEKTIERPRRKRLYSSGGKPAPGHRRTRSGDSAAANLMTGGTDWVGMNMDNLPLPPSPEEHDEDEDDDDGGSNAISAEERFDEVSKLQQQFHGDSRRKKGFNLGSLFKKKKASDGSKKDGWSNSSDALRDEGKGFTPGKNGKRSPSRSIRRSRLFSRQRQKNQKHEEDLFVLSDSTDLIEDVKTDAAPATPEALPRQTEQSTSQPEKTVRERHIHTNSNKGPKVPAQIERRHQQTDSISTIGVGDSVADASRRSILGGDSLEGSGIGGDVDPLSPIARKQRGRALSRDNSVGAFSDSSYESSQGSRSSTFSWISSRLSVVGSNMPRITSLPNPFGSSRNMNLYGSDEDASARNSSGSKLSALDAEEENSISASADDEKTERRANILPGERSPMETPVDRQRRISPEVDDSSQQPKNQEGDESPSFVTVEQKRALEQEREHQRRLRAFDTHMKSLSNVSDVPFSGAPPILASEEEAKEYSTFVCPRCNTRQREFFSVANAPRQFESPAGYLAFYFAIYVIASLFIFGLEEGWPPLDCVYFSVITLTTAGLGDYVPTTDGAKVICSIFIYFGVACIGLLLGSLLASSLDDASRKAAKENQARNCRNCERLHNLKARSRRPNTMFDSTPNVSNFVESSNKWNYERPPMNHASMPMDDGDRAPYFSNGDDTPPTPNSRGSKQFRYNSGLHKNHQLFRVDEAPSNQSQSSSTLSSDSDQADQRSDGSGQRSLITPAGSPAQRQDTPQMSGVQRSGGLNPNESLNVIDSWGGTAEIQTPPRHTSDNTTHGLSPTQGFSPGAWIGAQTPAEIMGRQSHTRHTSIDMQTGGFSALNPSIAKMRGFSADYEEAPLVIDERTPFIGNQADITSGDENEEIHSDVDSEDDSASTTSSSSFSSSQSDQLKPVSRVKAAKYVFLTLKQAVANSIFIIAIGSFGFYFIERMSAIDSFYFTTVLLTTVGYGDIVPHTSEGKMFATVYVLVAGTVLLHNMSMISMIPLELRKRRIERAVLMQFGDQLDDAALTELATGPLIKRLQLATHRPTGLDECTREMFALAMLVRLGRITENDVRSTFAAFRRLDHGNDGKLNSRDIIEGHIMRRRATMAVRQSQQVEERKVERMPFGSYFRPEAQNVDVALPDNEQRRSDMFTSWDQAPDNNPPNVPMSTSASQDSSGIEFRSAVIAPERISLLHHPLSAPGGTSAEAGIGYLSVTPTSGVLNERAVSQRVRMRMTSGDSNLSSFGSDVEMGFSGDDGGYIWERPPKRANTGISQRSGTSSGSTTSSGRDIV